MAGDWIPMRVSLPNDPAVIAIAAMLRADEDLVVGKLFRFWTWADQQCADGNAPGVTESWLDRYVSAAGFAAALVKVGWLIVDGDGLKVPKFDRWMGNSGKKRLKTNQRVARHREEKRSGNADSVTKSVTREQYSTEDSNDDATDRSASAGDDTAASTADTGEVPDITLPTVTADIVGASTPLPRPQPSPNAARVTAAIRAAGAADHLSTKHVRDLIELSDRGDPVGLVCEFIETAARASPARRGKGFVSYVETCLANRHAERDSSRRIQAGSQDGGRNGSKLARTVIHE